MGEEGRKEGRKKRKKEGEEDKRIPEVLVIFYFRK
jgi:hypothetical protein